MKPFLTRWMVTTLAVFIATIVPGIHFSSLPALLMAGLILGILNALVRPLVLLLSLPLILMTMGLFFFVVNAVMLRVVAGIVPGFYVNGFGAALLGSMVISLVSWSLNVFLKGTDARVRVATHHAVVNPEMKEARGRVIE